MKTIFVKDIARRLVLEDTINWKKVVPTIVFLGAMFLLGRMAAEVYAETAQTIGSKVLEGENWGLGFGGEGQKPTGNAAAEELKKYNAYFCGEGQEKVIYLTFDCGGREGEYFALRVRGESMLKAGILPDDLVVVRRQPSAVNGEIVVALLGDEATVKRLSRRNGEIWLLPENDAYQPINGTGAQVLGRVTAVVRQYD